MKLVVIRKRFYVQVDEVDLDPLLAVTLICLNCRRDFVLL